MNEARRLDLARELLREIRDGQAEAPPRMHLLGCIVVAAIAVVAGVFVFRKAADELASMRPGEPRTPPAPPSKPVLPDALPRLPDAVANVLEFSGTADEAAAETIRTRLVAAGIAADVTATGGALSVRVEDGTLAHRAGWLVTRRGDFSVHRVVPREENDKWTPPARPDGCEWVRLNLAYPAPPAGERWRLVRSDPLPVYRGDVTIAQDATTGRVVWSSAKPLPAESWVALVMDSEIVWYGPGAPSGTLFVSSDAPQSLTPTIHRWPLAVAFARK